MQLGMKDIIFLRDILSTSGSPSGEGSTFDLLQFLPTQAACA